MFEFIRGKHYASTSSYAVIDVQGIGYKAGISMNTFAAMPEVGEEVSLFMHFHVTENSQSLFGFISNEEREVFRVLISINKVGPKVAINVLSTLSVEQIVTAVEQQDVALFKAVSGIGPKTASRLLLELKGKMNIKVQPSTKSSSTHEGPVTHAVEDEAFTALIALGYTESQVKLALNLVSKEANEESPVHEWITLALKVI